MPYRSSVNIAVNGQQQSLEVDHRTTLLEVLRDHLDLTGAKRACDRGECGACTVLLDGSRCTPANSWPCRSAGALSSPSRGWQSRPIFAGYWRRL